MTDGAIWSDPEGNGYANKHNATNNMPLLRNEKALWTLLLNQ